MWALFVVVTDMVLVLECRDALAGILVWACWTARCCPACSQLPGPPAGADVEDPVGVHISGAGVRSQMARSGLVRDALPTRTLLFRRVLMISLMRHVRVECSVRVD